MIYKHCHRTAAAYDGREKGAGLEMMDFSGALSLELCRAIAVEREQRLERRRQRRGRRTEKAERRETTLRAPRPHQHHHRPTLIAGLF